ncbi:MAG: cytochrome P450 [Pseudomonadales bacterium]
MSANELSAAGSSQPTLESIDVSDSSLYERGKHWALFERLRREDPVHYTPDSPFGSYWSVTTYPDIKYVDTHHQIFSSSPTIAIGDPPEGFALESFIETDPPKHDAQRKGVMGAVSPRNLANLEPVIRERVLGILDQLPIGETFDWVDHVSIELTTQMLATLFDFPFEERRRLTYWSDCITSSAEQVGATGMTEEDRRAELMECLVYFNRLWETRKGRPGNDFVSMMANSDAFQNMPPLEFLGNLALLIVGGNDTTRNSISGGVYALNRFPAEYDKLRNAPSLIPNMISEIIRWQTPLAHMRRTALTDTDLRGRRIRAGDRVVMWYISGNRDESVFSDADAFRIDRENARAHMAFGFGVHRCMGNRLAEMQLRVLWEELLGRFEQVEVVGEPVRIRSNFVHGYASLPVRLHPARKPR